MASEAKQPSRAEMRRPEFAIELRDQPQS